MSRVTNPNLIWPSLHSCNKNQMICLYRHLGLLTIFHHQTRECSSKGLDPDQCHYGHFVKKALANARGLFLREYLLCCSRNVWHFTIVVATYITTTTMSFCVIAKSIFVVTCAFIQPVNVKHLYSNHTAYIEIGSSLGAWWRDSAWLIFN